MSAGYRLFLVVAGTALAVLSLITLGIGSGCHGDGGGANCTAISVAAVVFGVIAGGLWIAALRGGR